MGILNVTPDSFSGDGLLGAAGADPVAARRSPRAGAMVDEGADLLDVGGESTRPGHAVVAGGRGDRPGRAGRRAPSARRCPTCRSASTRRRPRSRPRPSTPAPTSSTTSGASRRTTRSSALAAERGVPIVLMHNRAEPRYTNLMAEVVADLEAAIDRALARRRRLGRDHRRSRVRVRQDGRAQPRAAARARRAPRPRPADPPRDLAQVDPRQGPRPAARRARSRRRSRRPPSGSPPASTSSASTTSGRTSAPPGWPTRSSAAVGRPREGVRAERPDRAPQHPASRAATATTTHELRDAPAVRGRRRAPAQPPAGRRSTTTSRRPSTTRAVYDVVRQIVEIDARSGCSRRSPRRSATRSSPTSPSTRSASGSASPAVQLGGPLDYAGVEIWRRRSRCPSDGAGRDALAEVRRPRPERDVDRQRLAVAEDVSVTCRPATNWARTASSGWSVSIVWSPIFVTMSPSLTPALRPGRPRRPPARRSASASRLDERARR